MKKMKRKDAVTDEERGAANLSVPKLCGSDIEYGNCFEGNERSNGTGNEASVALLREIPGLPPHGESQSAYQGHKGYVWNGGWDDYPKSNSWGYYGSNQSQGHNPEDRGRKYLSTNGGCAYIDLSHLEICTPEVISAWHYVACFHAMLRMVSHARDLAQHKLPDGIKLHVLANNSDGQSNSYGSHLNFLVAREIYQNITKSMLHYTQYFASYLASSILFTGAGKVGSENGRSAAAFQISQRADFFETILGKQTTYNRPMVNSRDESHCGSHVDKVSGHTTDMARLHVIFFDNNLCHVATLLKVGVTQIILAMIEQDWIVLDLILKNPLQAVLDWSHDPSLRSTAETVLGSKLTALEHQFGLMEQAKKFVEEGRAEGLVPRASEIIELWEDTLDKFKKRDFRALARRLDWVLKLKILKKTIKSHGLTWTSPQIKHLDILYSSINPENGLYWAYEQSGFVEKVVTLAEIEHFTHEPPDDTRAWLRAHILRRVDRSEIHKIEWDHIQFKQSNNRGDYWVHEPPLTFRMDDPLGFTRAHYEEVLNMRGPVLENLETMGLLKESRVTWNM